MRIAVILLLAVLTGCSHPRPGRILTWQEYGRVSVEWPYVLRIAGSRGELLYYGARHTYLPGDPQIDEIERLWTAFRPDIAFNEGGNPPIESSREDTVRKGGESAFVRFLAARDNVPVTTLDPSRAEEVAHLKRKFTAEEIKLFYVLRTGAQFTAKGTEGPVEKEVERVLAIHNATPGLMGPPRTLDEVEAAFRQRFPGKGKYQDTPLSWLDPVFDDSFLNRIARESSDYRDRFMVEKIRSHLEEGHRIFAVVGGTHVVMQEPALMNPHPASTPGRCSGTSQTARASNASFSCRCITAASFQAE